jgi:hypothetical protein
MIRLHVEKAPERKGKPGLLPPVHLNHALSHGEKRVSEITLRQVIHFSGAIS